MKNTSPPVSKEIPMEQWEKHFKKILNITCRENIFDPLSREPLTETTEPIAPITKRELKHTIATSKNRKAPGPDGIPTEHLKESLHLIEDFWVKLLHKCLALGEIPEHW